MKKIGKKRVSLKLYFIASTFGVLVMTVAAAAVILFLFNLAVPITVTLPSIIWMVIFSVAVGAVASTVFSRWIISPIERLSSAINRVSDGDYTVRIETESRFDRIQAIYDDFNLMAKELGSTEMLKNDFISNVSHEFKTPLAAVEGYAMLLQDCRSDGEERDEIVAKILENTRRLSDLVGNILLLNKVSNQPIPLEGKAFRLDEQIRRALLSLERQWSEKSIEFDVEMEPLIYFGPENLMLHVWVNLIDNAVKFSPFGGTVKISLSALGTGVARFCIEDDGPGIPADSLPHIFEKFYQADSSHRSEGSGLGLSLVRQILDVCRCTITAESSEDCGARFTVDLVGCPAPQKKNIRD